MWKFVETVVSDYCLCGSVDGSNEGWVPFVKNKLTLFLIRACLYHFIT